MVLDAGAFAGAFCQRVRNSLGNKGFSTAGRPVEQDAFRRFQSVLAVQLRMQERQLNSIADLLNLGSEAANVRIGDVWHLFEDQVLHLGAGNLLQGVAGAPVHRQAVTYLDCASLKRSRQADYTLIIGPAGDQHTRGAQQFLDGN